MRLPDLGLLPGPHDLKRLLDEALSLVPRGMALLESAERLLADATALLARVEETRAAADALVRRAELTRARADRAVADIDAPFRRLVGLLDVLEPPLLRLQPTLDRLAETTDPREVDAAVAMIDRMPELVDRFENDVLPLLQTLGTVGPDMHDLLLAFRELGDLVGNIPGMGRVRRRVEEEQPDGD